MIPTMFPQRIGPGSSSSSSRNPASDAPYATIDPSIIYKKGPPLQYPIVLPPPPPPPLDARTLYANWHADEALYRLRTYAAPPCQPHQWPDDLGPIPPPYPAVQHHSGPALDVWHLGRPHRLLSQKPPLSHFIRAGERVVKFKTTLGFRSGYDGAAMINLLKKGEGILSDVEDHPFVESARWTIQLRIAWPGYKQCLETISVFHPRRGYITTLQLAIVIAQIYDRFVKANPVDEARKKEIGRFRIGPGALATENLRLVQIVHTGDGIYQADIQCVFNE